MILRIVLFLSYGMLVSSNNGYPIIPAQTYPIYQQNGYSNPPANQPSDIASYLQSMMVQNQSPSLDLSPSNIKQFLLNRLLSGHSLQTNFDQNSRGYSSNLVELLNNAIAPNVVNSYLAAPTVNSQAMRANNEDKTQHIKKEEKRRKTKKRKSKSRRKQDESKNNHDNSNNDKVYDLQESRKKTKKRSRKPKTEVSDHANHTKSNDNENNKKTKKKKRKNKESEVKNPADEEIEMESPTPRRRHKKKKRKEKENADKEISEQQTTPKTKQIQEGINVAHFNEGIIEENRIPRNPIPEGTDLFKSIPNSPENIANSVNFQGLPQFNNPAMSDFFANYENIYKSMVANKKGTNEHIEIKRRKPTRSRNNNRRNNELKNKNSTAAVAAVMKNPKNAVIPKINVVTPDKTITIKEKISTDVEPIPKDEFLNSTEKLSEVKESLHEFDNEEIKDMQKNINDPAMNYNDYIDDYYPQFTDSAAFTANNREVYIKNLGDTKYYYAVDKRNPEFINKMRFESFGLPERIIKDYEVSKKYGDTEKEGIKNALNPDPKAIEEETVQFRSPPQLEIPDFQTRKVERIEINQKPQYNFDENADFDPRFLGDKVSVYSEAKVPYYPGTKENSKKIVTNKPKDVETVFARSKVVNYSTGPVYNPEEEDSVSAGTSHQDFTDDSNLKDEGTTYVLATSLDHPRMVW